MGVQEVACNYICLGFALVFQAFRGITDGPNIIDFEAADRPEINKIARGLIWQNSLHYHAIRNKYRQTSSDTLPHTCSHISYVVFVLLCFCPGLFFCQISLWKLTIDYAKLH